MKLEIDHFLAGAALWLLLVACAWVYSPGLDGPFLLDDAVNLRPISSIDDNLAYLEDVVKGNTSGPSRRPLSMASFAFTYVAAGASSYAFKAHNLGLHLVVGCLLCWLFYLLARVQFASASALFATTGAALWLFSPLLLSTVLYPVQRMTQLAMLMVVAALVLFCKARVCFPDRRRTGVILLGCSLAMALLAPLAKENGAIAVVLLLLTEFAVFRPVSPTRYYLIAERSVFVAGAAAGIGILVFILSGGGETSFLSYADRDFSMRERLLTEARVLWDYIWKFFWPVGQDYGLFHDDFTLSTGVLKPVSTLTSVVGICGLAMWAAWSLLRRKHVLVGYGILFFLAGHAIESSVVPLELYFEHRNYLPVLGLAIATCSVALAAARAFESLRVLSGLVVGALLLLSFTTTGILATYWSSAELLVIREISAHPDSARANAQMATRLAKAGFPEDAVYYAKAAARIGRVNPATEVLREFALYCMASTPPPDAMLERISRSLGGMDDKYANEALDVVVDNVLGNRCDPGSADSLAELVYRHFEGTRYLTPRALALMAKMENHSGRYERAFEYAEALADARPDEATGYLMTVYFAQILDRPEARRLALERLRAIYCRGHMTSEEADNYKLFAGLSGGDAVSYREQKKQICQENQ